MKFTLGWLKEHLDTTADTAAVVETMTQAGLEVEHVIDRTADLAPFSVAHILSAEQHPNADRLRVCQVATRDGTLQIVCGAPNARAGIAVVYAAVGTYVPGIDVTLSKASIRGVDSNGMLCSAKEIGVGLDGDGIIDLPTSIPVGTPAAEALGVADPVIDFEVTPNRPDWLGVHGIARDLAAAGLGTFKDSVPPSVAGEFPCPVTVVTEDTDACPVFAGRVIRGVTVCQSPDWLKQRLIAIGLRPINAVVDVTNYVAYDRARPLHAYDLSQIKGGRIAARMAADGESLHALDDKTHTLSAQDTVIADAAGVLAIAGVMGGAASGVSDTTTDIFLESAWFTPTRIAKTGKRLGISSDSQYRFARGVDTGQVLPGLERATQLILQICGGTASAVTVAGAVPDAPAPVMFHPQAVARLGGLLVNDGVIRNTLEALGFHIRAEGSAWHVAVPSWRRDVVGSADLVEEVVRTIGLAAIPATSLPEVASARLPLTQARARLARRHLAALGYNETISWSFVTADAATLFGGGQPQLKLANPIAADLSDMRPSALIGLLQAVARNQARAQADCALFEVGPVYHDDTPTGQRTAVAGVLAPKPPRHWAATAPEDLFTVKGDMLSVLGALGAPVASLQLDQDSVLPGFAPGQSARLVLGKVAVAHFGAVHPRVLKALDAAGPVYGFELWLDALPQPKARPTKTRPAWARPDQTPISRDFAFVVADDVRADRLVRAIAGVDKALIHSVRVFDVYRGAGVPAGHVSLAVEVTLQPQGKAMTDADITALSAQIIGAAEKATGASLRT